jgi:signal transduction histidine kinase
VWPSVDIDGEKWSEQDKDQVSRAAQSLSMALSMDTERTVLQRQSDRFRDSLSDSLHQVKNPLQALRTYGKLLQQQIAQAEDMENIHLEMGGMPQLLALARHLMVQSDRVADLLLPMDTLVAETPKYLMPSPEPNPKQSALARYQPIHNVTGVEVSDEKSERDDVAKKSSAWDRKGAIKFRRSPAEPVVKTIESSEVKTEPSVVGDLDLQIAFIMDILEPILSAFRVIAADRGIQFTVAEETDELPGVTVCTRSLQEAMSNIVDNAMKYVMLPKKGSGVTENPDPRVRVRLLTNQDPDPPGVTIVVEDNGPGIPQDERAFIFERGFRGTLTTPVDGSGIGLDISRTLIERMGGRLIVSSPRPGSPYNGAVMRIVLYRKPPLDNR